jgi:four helix bundle protein
MTAGAHTPIFTRSYDFLLWLMQVTRHFPRMHRHDFTKRLLDAAFDLRERLEEANFRRGAARRERLGLADEALGRVRTYVRLAARMGWLTEGQYGHAAAQTTEIGKLLGAWLKLP